MACSCTKGRFPAPDGSDVDIVTRLDTSCPDHGFPNDQWYAKHPLRRHAREITEDVTHGKGSRWEFTREETRLERPSETYARLMAEANDVLLATQAEEQRRKYHGT